MVYLCSLLPHASVSTVASFCLSRLRLTEVADVDVAETAGGLGDIDEVAPTYTNALCNWGRGDDLLDLIIGWIRKDCGKSLEATAEVAKTEPPRRKGRGVRFAEAAEEESGKPVLALLLVEYAMQHPVNRAILLRKNRAQLEELRSSLLAYVPIIRTHLRGEGACDKTGKKLAMVWKLALKLTVLLQEEGEADASCSETLGKIEDLMEWTEKEVLTEEGGSGSGNSTRLGVELSRSTVSVCCDMVTIGVCDINFIGHLLELCGMLLNKGTATTPQSLGKQMLSNFDGFFSPQIQVFPRCPWSARPVMRSRPGRAAGPDWPDGRGGGGRREMIETPGRSPRRTLPWTSSMPVPSRICWPRYSAVSGTWRLSIFLIRVLVPAYMHANQMCSADSRLPVAA